MAIYECRDCNAEKLYPRRFTYHFGPYCRCPHCGTFRVTKLKAPDTIDPLKTGFLNYLERLAGGTLYHCRYCRVQFYDRRILASEGKAPEPNGREVAPSRDAEDYDV